MFWKWAFHTKTHFDCNSWQTNRHSSVRASTVEDAHTHTPRQQLLFSFRFYLDFFQFSFLILLFTLIPVITFLHSFVLLLYSTSLVRIINASFGGHTPLSPCRCWADEISISIWRLADISIAIAFNSLFISMIHMQSGIVRIVQREWARVASTSSNKNGRDDWYARIQMKQFSHSLILKSVYSFVSIPVGQPVQPLNGVKCV